MKICKNCGKEISDGDKFCVFCGMDLMESPADRGNLSAGMEKTMADKEQMPSSMEHILATEGAASGKQQGSQKTVMVTLGIIGSILGLIGCFLPLYGFNFLGVKQSQLLIRCDDGVIIATMLLAALALISYGKYRLAVIPVGIGIASFAYDMYQLKEIKILSFYSGFYLIIGASIILLVSVILSFFGHWDQKGRTSMVVSLLILAASLILIPAGWRINKDLDRKETYEMAMEFMKDKTYEYAIQEFREVGDYKEAKVKILECQYLWADEMRSMNLYEDARALFGELGKYQDSAVKIQQCNYEEVVFDYNQDPAPDIAAYIKRMAALSSYEPAAKQCETWIHNTLVELENDTDNAIAFLEALQDSINVSDRIQQYKFKKAKEVYAAGDADNALILLNELKDYAPAKQYKKKVEKQIEENTPPAVPDGLRYEDVTDPTLDGSTYRVLWNSVKGADGYEYLYAESVWGMDEEPYVDQKSTTDCYTEVAASDTISVEISVRAYKNVRGERLYSDWSDTIYFTLNE